jgi:hypothetical protein
VPALRALTPQQRHLASWQQHDQLQCGALPLRTLMAARNASGSPASLSCLKLCGSWWMRSVITDTARENRLPPNSSGRVYIACRQAASQPATVCVHAE